MKLFTFILIILARVAAVSQTSTADSSSIKTSSTPKMKSLLRYNFNENGSHFFQVNFLNQTWLRYNESNPGTTLFGKNAPNSFDIGLRRTRIQMFGQISDRTFVYFQFGQNNFNNTYNYSGNRKLAAFVHDAVCEFRASKGDHLKIGAGLTIMNGLSRFSQPSISSIMGLDVPVFLQYSVDQIDQFDRRLAIYARGQLGKFDYRLYVADPFPVNSNGSQSIPIGRSATFVNTAAFGNPGQYSNGYGPGINKQFGGYFAWNFFENEPHLTPYMSGTYLGAKKVFNVAIGGVYQKSATWYLKSGTAGVFSDTVYADMMHLSFETFLDMPLSKENGSAINFFAGYFNTNYGYDYLRYNGIMNPATASNATNLIQNGAYGNAFPMFGSGHVVYTQLGYLLPNKFAGENNSQLMPFISAQYADYSALNHLPMLVFDTGLTWFIKGHQSKLSVDFQNRPTFYFDQNQQIKSGNRKNCVILQYQIFI